MSLREKTPHAVVTFASTADAMAVQAAADAGKVPGRVIPVPSAISAGCGLAWCVPASERGALLDVLAAQRLAYEGVHEVDLY